MPRVKGIVLLSRFEYLDHKQGISALKKLLKKISTPDENFIRQPVDGAHFYPSDLIGTIDEILLTEHFEDDIDEFFRLGEWTAQNLMAKYFNLYMEESEPKEFLEQFARLRDSLIGTGKMSILEKSIGKIEIIIDYGQTVPKSVCLSEQGFISKGLRLCGAKNLQVNEIIFAGEGDSLKSKYEVTYD